MKKSIYLDYNATTPIDQEVIDAMLPYIQDNYGNPSSSYSMGIQTKEAIKQARMQVAALINADPEEIVFSSGGTESNNQAILGIALANQKKGRHIITTSIEHPAVTEVCKHLEKQAWEVSYIPVDNEGFVNLSDIENSIRKDTTLISVMHANNEVGTIQNIEEIGAIAHKHQLAFHTDAAQSVGKIKIDIKKQNIDLLTIAGHKLYAPKGIGALFLKKNIAVENIMFGASQEKGIRPGTENVPYIVALGKACEIAKRDFVRNTKNMSSTRDKLFNGLQAQLKNRIQRNGSAQHCLPNTLSIAFNGINSHSLASAVSNELNLSTGSACHADSIEISSVLQAMNIDPSIAASTVRISTGKYTTDDDINKAIEIIVKAIHELS